VALTLRLPGLGDEAACVEAHHEFEDAEFESFPFLLLWEPDLEWSSYVALLEGLRNRTAVPEGLVPSTFLLAEVDGELVGRVSVRFALNDYLAAQGGNIGYGVRPAFRGRGYATDILRQAVTAARAEGVERILVVCDDDNVGSIRVIERSGGVLESVVTPTDGGAPFRRYWIG
jgi:predicted acetyltransferase